MITFVALFTAAVALVRALFGTTATARRAPWFVVVVAAVALPPMIVFEKAVGRALLPLGLMWVVLWCIVVWRVGVGDARRARGVAALAVIVTVLGNEPIGHVLMEVLERDYRTDPYTQAPFDAVIVLGGGAQRSPHGRHELSPSGDRVFTGARLWHRGLTKTLVATGTPIGDFRDAFDSTVATRDLWRDVGVVDDAIVIVGGTRNTREEATACAALIAQRGWRRVGLVTSAWHMRRSVGLFRRAGVEVVPLPADSRAGPTWDGIFSLVPVGEGAWLQQKAIWEFISAAVGR